MTSQNDIETFFRDVIALLKRDLDGSSPSVREAILRAGRKALKATRKDVVRWNRMLISGALTREEYEWLIASRVSLIQVESLRASGLALARVDAFRASLIRSIVGAALQRLGI